MDLLRDFVRCIQQLIEADATTYPPALFTDPVYLYGDKRQCHRLVIKLLKTAGSMMPTVASVTGEGARLLRRGSRKGWIPDVVLWSAEGRILCVVEYESVNSSDERIYEKDI